MDSTPILIGAGQVTERVDDPGYQARSPVELGAAAARLALADADVAAVHVDLAAGVRQIETSVPEAVALFGRSNNFPRSVLARLGHQPGQAWLEAPGGQSPQTLVNATAAAIAEGRVALALLVGAEALSTQRHLLALDQPAEWGETVTGSLVERGAAFDDTLGGALIQAQRFDAAAGYALFDQARRARLKVSRAEYRRAIGGLFAPFSRVAADNPLAALREAFSSDDLATPGPRNRLVADPYTRLTVARDLVNQAAALVVTSVGRARQLGVPEERWVYLHGHAQAAERPVLERPDLDRSPAAVRVVRAALSGAVCTLDDLRFLDLYSCFAAPVFNLTDAFGLVVDDPRGLTVTGGLPFFGGPGNDYSLHAIATMVERLRGASGTLGLVGANGGYMSKVAVGIYGTRARPFVPADHAALQAELDALPARRVAESPDGPASIDTHTVVYDREGRPRHGLIIGSLTDGERFLATVDDAHDLERLADEGAEPIGWTGRVRTNVAGRSRFALDRRATA